SVSGVNSLWFGGNVSRFATTRPLNLTAGGLISFYLRFANGGGFPWEMADLPDEGVVLEYSVNDGSNWVEIARFTDETFRAWTQSFLPIPPQAQTAPVLLRWRQLNNSGDQNDHWALDDVRVRAVTGPPQILAQPNPVSAIVGADVQFSVSAAGTQ